MILRAASVNISMLNKRSSAENPVKILLKSTSNVNAFDVSLITKTGEHNTILHFFINWNDQDKNPKKNNKDDDQLRNLNKNNENHQIGR